MEHDMAHGAELRIKTEHADSLKTALEPEADITQRTKVELLSQDNELVIRIQAEDTASLRAAINSYLRMARLAIDSHNALKGDE